MRKLPGNFKQYQVMKAHAKSMNHDDTNFGLSKHLQVLQCSSLGSVHLYIIMTNSAELVHMKVLIEFGLNGCGLYIFFYY